MLWPGFIRSGNLLLITMAHRLATFSMAVLLALPVRSSGQADFEVASVRENKDMSAGGTMELRPSLVRAHHMDAWSLVSIAYRLEPYQLFGMPDWTRSTYYDVNAKPGNSDATQDQLSAMLQRLIRGRFGLAVHRETRQTDGFVLIRASAAKLGPGLHVAAADCSPGCRSQIGPTFVKGFGITMETVRRVILNRVNAPVSDETQLTGTFDVDLHWSNDLAPTDDAGALFTALQEQLGLKLERRRVTVDVVVVDRIEHPTLE